MKYRMFTWMLAALCLTGLSGCGSTDSTPVSETTPAASDTAWAEPEEITITTKAYAERALSDEIPSKAVIRVKCTQFQTGIFQSGEQESVYLVYNDDHDNTLLSIKNPDDPGNSCIFLNAEYEYNENGDEVYHRMNSSDVNEEYYTKYDSSGRICTYLGMKKGVVSSQTRYEYDEYGNLLRKKHARYDDSGSKPTVVLTEDNSDCDYDGSGHMITVRQPDKTTEYTYDAEGRVLTETVRFEGDEKEEQKTVYAYDPLSGMETLMEMTCLTNGKITTKIRREYEYDSNQNLVLRTISNYDENGTVVRVVTLKKEYDSEGRLSVRTETVSDGDDISIIKYEYAKIG